MAQFRIDFVRTSDFKSADNWIVTGNKIPQKAVEKWLGKEIAAAWDVYYINPSNCNYLGIRYIEIPKAEAFTNMVYSTGVTACAGYLKATRID